jgi:hypothetical protein
MVHNIGIIRKSPGRSLPKPLRHARSWQTGGNVMSQVFVPRRNSTHPSSQRLDMLGGNGFANDSFESPHDRVGLPGWWWSWTGSKRPARPIGRSGPVALLLAGGRHAPPCPRGRRFDHSGGKAAAMLKRTSRGKHWWSILIDYRTALLPRESHLRCPDRQVGESSVEHEVSTRLKATSQRALKGLSSWCRARRRHVRKWAASSR